MTRSDIRIELEDLRHYGKREGAEALLIKAMKVHTILIMLS